MTTPVSPFRICIDSPGTPPTESERAKLLRELTELDYNSVIELPPGCEVKLIAPGDEPGDVVTSEDLKAAHAQYSDRPDQSRFPGGEWPDVVLPDWAVRNAIRERSENGAADAGQRDGCRVC